MQTFAKRSYDVMKNDTNYNGLTHSLTPNSTIKRMHATER